MASPAHSSPSEWSIGQAFLDGRGRRWTVHTAVRDENGQIGMLKLRLEFDEPRKPDALYVMTPREFTAVYASAGMTPLPQDPA